MTQFCDQSLWEKFECQLLNSGSLQLRHSMCRQCKGVVMTVALLRILLDLGLWRFQALSRPWCKGCGIFFSPNHSPKTFFLSFAGAWDPGTSAWPPEYGYGFEHSRTLFPSSQTATAAGISPGPATAAAAPLPRGSQQRIPPKDSVGRSVERPCCQRATGSCHRRRRLHHILRPVVPFHRLLQHHSQGGASTGRDLDGGPALALWHWPAPLGGLTWSRV